MVLGGWSLIVILFLVAPGDATGFPELASRNVRTFEQDLDGDGTAERVVFACRPGEISPLSRSCVIELRIFCLSRNGSWHQVCQHEDQGESLLSQSIVEDVTGDHTAEIIWVIRCPNDSNLLVRVWKWDGRKLTNLIKGPARTPVRDLRWEWWRGPKGARDLVLDLGSVAVRYYWDGKQYSPEGRSGNQNLLNGHQQTYHDGVLSEGGAPLNGERVLYHPATHTVVSQVRYLEGKLDGPCLAWHSNGSRAMKGQYLDGKRYGPWTAWFEDSFKKWEGTFREGFEHGPWTYWYSTGEVACEGAYVYGAREGIWRFMEENGQEVLVKYDRGVLMNNVSVSGADKFSKFTKSNGHVVLDPLTGTGVPSF